MFRGVNFAIYPTRKNCFKHKTKNKKRENIKTNVKCSTLFIFKMINYKRETPLI